MGVDRIEPGLVSAAAEPAMDYLVLAVTACSSGGHPVPRHTYESHLARALAFIADHLGDPLLSVARIAQALGLSEGHLHEIFSGAGQTTVSNHIREQRLLGARRDLADPSMIHLPVTEIAMKWGFSEASSFSRAFRNAYRTSPRAFRRALRQR
jgi:AraC-like DNA-binding protein